MTTMPQQPEDDRDQDDQQTQDSSGGQVSEGPNSLSSNETDTLGADAVTDKTTAAFKSNQEH